MQTNIEEIYEHQIKPLTSIERLRLVSKITAELADVEEPRERSLLELEGLGAEIWDGVDAQEYVNKLRDEWDHRP